MIGALFGDEGKGKLTDYFAAQGADLVIRFNGGAQAGHTVVAGGKRHVFSHFASGTLAGAATCLSRFFVASPTLFGPELEALLTLGVRPRVFVDPSAPLTTPYDMMINQITERERGKDRHGSCGIGFGETIERNLDPRYALTVADLERPGQLLDRLRAIRRDYVPRRLAGSGFAAAQRRWAAQLADCQGADYLDGDAIDARFLDEAEVFLGAVELATPSAAAAGRQVLFEGAQGLLLDQERGFFPHVTRSSTGLKNVLALAPELGIDQLDVTYATRAYLTRHGAGPLPGELPAAPFPDIADKTNVDNPHQGALRFALLDLGLLAGAIRADLSDADGCADVRVNAGLAINCLDQIDTGSFRYRHDGREHQSTIDSFLEALGQSVRSDWLLLGTGESRSAMTTLSRATTVEFDPKLQAVG